MDRSTASDHELMLAFQQGLDEAFDELFKRYESRLLNYVYRFFKRRDLAEEITQEIFLKLYKARKKYEPRAKFSSWLYRIATNVCLKRLKRKEFDYHYQPIDEGPAVKLADETESADQQMMDREEQEMIRKCIDQLHPKRQAVIILRTYEEMGHIEIAEALGSTESAVKSLLHRAYRDLEKAIKKKREQK